ncbi:MAG: HAD hydrolase-like protein [bacterium]|nr:HAD hydrolase-like protein [bacterium]
MRHAFDAIILDCYGVILTPQFPLTPNCLIQDTLTFITTCDLPLYVASSAETTGLKKMLASLEIAHYFKEIYGGPLSKADNITTIILEHDYAPDRVVLIGDSGSDWDAAKESGIQFRGYNNLGLSQIEAPYIRSFSDLKND